MIAWMAATGLTPSTAARATLQPPDGRSPSFAAAARAATSAETVEVLQRMHAPVPEHAKRLTAEMVRKADLVLGMTASHVARARALVANDPAAVSRVQLLDPSGDVDDPIGLGQRAYDELGAYFAQLIPQRVAGMLSP